MRKIFIIFLTLVLVLCSFNVTIAKEEEIDVIGNIKEQLNEIENSIIKNNQDEAKEHLVKLREYVYKWVSELTKQNLYTDKAIDIINFASQAIEEKDVEYIAKARTILEEIISNKPILVTEGNHS